MLNQLKKLEMNFNAMKEMREIHIGQDSKSRNPKG